MENLQVKLKDKTYKTTIQNMHKHGWKAQFFKSADVLMLGHGCCVSLYTQFYDILKIYIKYYHVHMYNLFR